MPPLTEYDKTVLSHQPKHFYPALSGQTWPDSIGDADGRFFNGRGESTMPDGSVAPHFDGATQWARMPDRSAFGPAGAATAWTVTCWVRPRVLRQVNDRSEGYVHWIGKKNEWLSRIYNDNAMKDGEPYRQNWLSCYVFDPDEQFGAGQRYEDGFQAREWLHVAFVVRTDERRQCGLFVNGRQSRGWASLEDNEGSVQFDVRPINTTAPLIVGRDSTLGSDGKPRSWFRGAVGKPAFFTYDLSAYGVSAEYPAGRITQQALIGRTKG